MLRRALPIVLLPLLAGCDEQTIAMMGGQPPTVTQQCVGKTARALKVKTGDITVLQALSAPEGDIVTMQVAGEEGRIRCMTDVDGNIGDLVRLGPVSAPAQPSPVGG